MPAPKQQAPIIGEILGGKYDDNLDHIDWATKRRKQLMFSKGSKVLITGTKNPTLDGQHGVVIKVNAKRITVGVGEPETDQFGTTWSVGEYLIPTSMLKSV